ncbi:hypothetical protein ACFO5X_19660 [Seohaeicola nanhaiensis]|uniref:Secreted protein n=1 Tax=Seohaeicola nanhaiensis TaxID=1387282 RepID=A0ABV9KL37_9RHOB
MSQLRKCLSVWTALIFAVSILLGPANATTMMDCDVVNSNLSQEDGTDIRSGSATNDIDKLLQQYQEARCANHFCALAFHPVQTAPSYPQNLIFVRHDLSTRSMVSLVSPDGLRRPPRI